jgi:hypothetical protein
MRKRLLESFQQNEAAAMVAMARRWGNPRSVQDMWECPGHSFGSSSRWRPPWRLSGALITGAAVGDYSDNPPKNEFQCMAEKGYKYQPRED